MNSSKEESAGGAETPLPVLPPSAGVRLEIAILDADHDATVAPKPTDEHPHVIVLVVAAEADLRRYVRECLRDRGDIVLFEADTLSAARVLVEREKPKILITDDREAATLAVMWRLRVILLVDEVPRHATSDVRLRLLARPFSAERLLIEVSLLLS